jgi:hypothetical protein
MVADAQLAGHPSQDAFELRVPPAHVLAYPWRNYRGEWQAPTERPNERAVRFLNMMMNLLRNHGHTGLMAVFEKKLEGRQSIKQAQFASVISELEASGVVRQQGGLIFLQPSWVPHRYSGKARDGLPTLDDQYEHWAPVLDRISAVLDSTSEGA